jgi:hypothetical protein
MSHRKKKPSGQKQQAVATAHKRNEFFRNLYLICKNAGCPQLYSQIPADKLETIYNIRWHSLKPFSAEGYNIPNSILKEIKFFASYRLKEISTPIMPGGDNYTLEEFFTVGIAFTSFLVGLKDDDFPLAAELKKALTCFSDYHHAQYQILYQHINEINGFVGLLYSDLNSCLYWGKHESRIDNDRLALLNCLDIYSCIPEKRHITIDGKPRPATRVGWAFPNTCPNWLKVKPSDMGINNAFSEMPLEVFIQAHALQRISERLDILPAGLAHNNIFHSLHDVKALKDFNGNTLIEYRIAGIKAGYLRADIVDGVVLIRTFLFLTHEGTPESEKLKELLGIQKMDTSYFSLDKLSTFMSSDLNNDEKFKNIFIKAGFGRLFEIYDALSMFTDFRQDESPAMKLAYYLRLQEKLQQDDALANNIVKP